MKSLNSEYIQKQPITHNLLQTIRRIAEYKGKQDLYREQSPQVLDAIGHFRGDFTIRDLQESCPHVGIDLIRRILREQKNMEKLECLGRGPNAKWRNR